MARRKRSKAVPRTDLGRSIACKAVRRRVLDIALAGGSAARWFGGRVLEVAWGSGSAAGRFGGRVLVVALAGGSAGRRFGGRVLDVELAGDVYAGPMMTEVAKLTVGEGNRRNGGQTTGRGRDPPTQANARCRRLGGGVATRTDEIDAYGVGAGKAVGFSAV